MNEKFLWYFGQVLLVLIIITSGYLLLFVQKVLSWFELFPFDESKHTFLFLFIIALFAGWNWIYFGNWWKMKSLEWVNSDQLEQLNARYRNKKESPIISKYGNLNFNAKIWRLTLVAVMFILAILGDNYKNERNEAFASLGLVTGVEIKAAYQTVKNKSVFYQIDFKYKIDGIEYENSVKPLSGFKLNPMEINGFEIVEGDSFSAKYLPNDVQSIHVDFNEPLKETQIRYLVKTIKSLSTLYPDSAKSICIAERFLEEYGLSGLALLINRNESFNENDKFNSVTFDYQLSKESIRELFISCGAPIPL